MVRHWRVAGRAIDFDRGATGPEECRLDLVDFFLGLLRLIGCFQVFTITQIDGGSLGFLFCV